MAEEALARAGLYLDELNKMRVLRPGSQTQSGELRDECREFLMKVGGFQKSVDSQIQIISTLSAQVERAKLQAIGSRNQLKSMSKEKDAELEKLEGLIREKQMELERLRNEHDALLKEETDFKDNLALFIAPM